MAGGIFTLKNKVLAGAYINVEAAQQAITGADNVTGVVFTIANNLGWGADGVIEVNAQTDFFATFANPISSDLLTGLRQILANAKTVYVYNNNAGSKSAGVSASLPWTFEALYSGELGDKLNVTVQQDLVNIGKFIVTTTLSQTVVDKQTISVASDLKANKYVVPTLVTTGTPDTLLGSLTTPVSVKLAGGSNAAAEDATEKMQAAFENYEYNTIVAADASDTGQIHALIAATAVRLREEQGREVQAVIPAKAGVQADNEGIIVVGNTVQMADGLQLSQAQFAGFIAGATASAADNVSLTYAKIIGAVDAVPRLTDDEAIAAIKRGELIARATRGFVRIETDINSLVTINGEKSADFAKNRVIRVLDTFRNWLRVTWEDNFVGQVTNDATGRDLLKATIANYLTEAQARGSVQSFKVDDIVVVAGTAKDSVVVTVAITPTDAMEKLYCTVTVN